MDSDLIAEYCVVEYADGNPANWLDDFPDSMKEFIPLTEGESQT